MVTAASALLAWYDRERRQLPWRAAPGQGAEPYRVWLSEVMLQQTTVVTVIPYFQRFLERWPTVQALAAAELEAVRQAWAGLGYYRRAANLHACARLVVSQYDGRFPDSEDGLRRLPGLGPYSAAAIAAIAFDRPATVVDGNVERVVARLFALEQPLPAAKPALRALAATLTPSQRAGDFAQAMMDLGAGVCTPRRPRCLLCPLRALCKATATGGLAESLPRRTARAAKPLRSGVVYWLSDDAGRVLLRRRAEQGLLGGMTELPSTVWQEGALPDWAAIVKAAPAATVWRAVPGQVRHSFTHFHLTLTVVVGTVDVAGEVASGFWAGQDQLAGLALPSVMRKVVAHVLASNRSCSDQSSSG